MQREEQACKPGSDLAGAAAPRQTIEEEHIQHVQRQVNQVEAPGVELKQLQLQGQKSAVSKVSIGLPGADL
jgi:hypothetical protein